MMTKLGDHTTGPGSEPIEREFFDFQCIYSYLLVYYYMEDWCNKLQWNINENGICALIW